MFHKPHQHPQTDQFDVQKIQQHIATINFLADALRLSTQRHHISSHLAVLQQAIKTFEKHRFSDYQLNKTKRAEQVLHTRKIFTELYKHHLKKEQSSLLALALKQELRDYATSVKGLISTIKSDLQASLQANHDAQMDEQGWSLLSQDLNRYEMQYAVSNFSAALENFADSDQDNVVSEDEYDYFDIEEEEYAQQPYLRGSFDFSLAESQPLLSDSDNYTWSDVAEEDMTSSDTEEFDFTSESNSPPQSPMLSRAGLFRLPPTRSFSSSNSDSDLDIDNSPQTSPRSYR